MSFRFTAERLIQEIGSCPELLRYHVPLLLKVKYIETFYSVYLYALIFYINCFMLQQILEILKYVLPAVVVLVATSLIVNKFLVKEIERKRLAIFEQNSSSALKLRLQAYERLVIFCERMHPTSLISRYYQQQATAQDVQLAMVQGIRAEFEHNLSQQLYVSHEVWSTIRTVMEQEITMINRVGASIGMGASATEFVKQLSEYVLTTESTMPTAIAIEAINREAKHVLLVP